MTITISHS